MEYRFEIHWTQANGYFWRFVAPNNQIVAVSGEGYTTKANAIHGIELIRRYGPGAPVQDKTGT